MWYVGGISNTVRWLESLLLSVLKNKWHHLAAEFHRHVDPVIHACFSIFGQITAVNDTFLNVKLSQIPHGKKKQESLIIYTTSLPVVSYLAAPLHRVHSVPVWLVAVMR